MPNAHSVGIGEHLLDETLLDGLTVDVALQQVERPVNELVVATLVAVRLDRLHRRHPRVIFFERVAAGLE